MSADDLISAIIAYDPRNYVPVEKIILPHFEVPEKACYRKELVSFLTDDAKFVVRLILNTPDDLMDTLFKDNGDIRITVFSDILKLRGWKPKKISSVFSELKSFVRNYYD